MVLDRELWQDTCLHNPEQFVLPACLPAGVVPSHAVHAFKRPWYLTPVLQPANITEWHACYGVDLSDIYVFAPDPVKLITDDIVVTSH